jgi:colanic acid/amylovoran biosynthesis protein
MKSETRPKRILITNIVSLNTGDAAILAGMFKILRSQYGSDTEFVVFDRAADVARRYYPWAQFRQSLFTKKSNGRVSLWVEKFGYGHWNLRLRYWKLWLAVKLCKTVGSGITRLFLAPNDRESVRIYARADLILSSGGTYLIEKYGLWAPIYDYRLSLASGTPLGFFTQTLGPFNRPDHRAAFSDVFRHSSCIFLRDERSRQNLIDIAVPAELIAIARDAAFVLEPTVKHDEKPKKDEGEKLKVAISVRSLNFFDDESGSFSKRYVESLRAVISEVVRSYGAKVVFLSSCQGIDEYWTDDSETAERVFSGLDEDVKSSVKVDRSFRQPQQIIDAYRNFDIVIATRMHAAILSLVAGTPVLGIAYEFKLEELFHDIGMPEACITTREINSQIAIDQFSRIYNGIEQYRALVEKVRVSCNNEAYSVTSRLPVFK